MNIPNECVTCTKTYDLTLSKQDGREVLTGDWKGYETLSKKACPWQNRFIPRYHHGISDRCCPTRGTGQIAERPEDRAPGERTVFDTPAETSTVKIDLYDNAEIDNDTVTIFLNKKLLLYKQRLTEKPLTLLLNALPNMDYELVMYADNLERHSAEHRFDGGHLLAGNARKYGYRLPNRKMLP